MESDNPRVVRFGVFEVNLATGGLRKNGARVKLQEQPFQVLTALLERPGEVVTKEELKERLWAGDTFVDFDHSLSTAVNKIREALGDSASSPRFLETVPRRGYRFIAPLLTVNEGSGASASVPQPPARPAARGRIAGWIGLAVVALLAVAAWVNRGGPESVRVEANPPKPLTSDVGYELSPSFSPDGNQVVYTWDGPNRNNFDLYVKLIGSSSQLRLTDTPENEYCPVWSPDGASIAFARETSPGRLSIFVMPAIGGPPRFLAEVASLRSASPVSAFSLMFYPSLSWTPDEAWLLTPDRDSAEDEFELRLVSLESGEKRALGKGLQGRAGEMSADGRALSFVRGGSLFVVSLTESYDPPSEPAELSEINMELGRPSWTPDGRHLLVTGVPDIDSSSHIWRVPVDGSASHPLWELGNRVVQPTVSRGGRLAFVRRMSDHNIWRAEFPEPGKPAERAAPLIDSTYADLNPEFSRDASKITFQSDRSGSDEIWVCDSDGSNLVKVTDTGEAGVGSPVWSPDGEHVAFDGFVEPEEPFDTPSHFHKWEVFVARSDGGAPTRLTSGGGNIGPAWSPDGQWVYYTQMRSWQIHRISVSGGQEELIAEDGFGVAVSPDGKWVYFARSAQQAPGNGIWRIPAEGGPEERIVEAVAGLRYAVTNGGVYFVPANSPTTIAYLDIATGTTTTVYETRKSLWRMDASDDGRQLLFNQLDQEGSDIMLVDGFRP